MFCRNCGATIDEGSRFCIRCGAPQEEGAELPRSEAPPPQPPGIQEPDPFPAAAAQPKSKIAAGVLGILLGWLGVHRFYLGYNTIGTVQLVLGLLGWVTCGVTTIAAAVWGIVEGILILTGSMRTDAQGRPLVD